MGPPPQRRPAGLGEDGDEPWIDYAERVEASIEIGLGVNAGEMMWRRVCQIGWSTFGHRDYRD